MSFWLTAEFAFQQGLPDLINEEIWADSALVQRELCNRVNACEKVWHGAQQASLNTVVLGPEAEGLILPWVPDVLGSQWNHSNAVHIVGSAYAGFIKGISRRQFPFEAYVRTSRLKWHDFAELYLRYVIRGDVDYYEPLSPILAFFGRASRFCLSDLCRASLVTRLPNSRTDRPILLKDDYAKELLASYIDSQAEWTWRRLSQSGRYVIALGLTAEYGLLRLFQSKGCRIEDSLTSTPWIPRKHRKSCAWTVSYAAQHIEKRVKSWAYWQVSRGQSLWNVIPIYHPQVARQIDPGYADTLRFIGKVLERGRTD